jgi:hypothetical protein
MSHLLMRVPDHGMFENLWLIVGTRSTLVASWVPKKRSGGRASTQLPSGGRAGSFRNASLRSSAQQRGSAARLLRSLPPAA